MRTALLGLLALACSGAPEAPPAPSVDPTLHPHPGTTGWSYKTAAGDWPHGQFYEPLDVLSTDVSRGHKEGRWWWLWPTDPAREPVALPCNTLQPTDRVDRVACRLGEQWGVLGPEGAVVSPTWHSLHVLKGGWVVGWTPTSHTLIDPEGVERHTAGHIHMVAEDFFVVSDRTLDTQAKGDAMVAEGAFARLDVETGETSPLPFYPVDLSDDGQVVAQPGVGFGVVPAGEGAVAWTDPRPIRLLGAGRAARQTGDGEAWLLVEAATGAVVGDGAPWTFPSAWWLGVNRPERFVADRLPVVDASTERCGYLAPDGSRPIGFLEGWAQCSPFERGRAVARVADGAKVFDPSGADTAWLPGGAP